MKCFFIHIHIYIRKYLSLLAIIQKVIAALFGGVFEVMGIFHIYLTVTFLRPLNIIA